MKNVDEIYETYYNAYKNGYDNDELNQAKKREFDYRQFKLGDKKDEEPKLTTLAKCLSSNNNFKKAIKSIEDIMADTNNIKSSSGKQKAFNDLNELINNIKYNKNTTKKKKKKKNAIEKIKNIISDLDQHRQRESTVFQNKMIDVVYYLFNSLRISSQTGRLMLSKWVKVSEERFNEILSAITKAQNKGLKTSVDGREITLDNKER